MPLPASGSGWKLAKWLLRHADEAIPLSLAYLSTMLDHEEGVTDIAWLRWISEWTRTTPAGTTEDVAQFKLDLLNITGGAIDTSWTAGDFTTVKGAFDTFQTAVAAQFSNAQTFSGYKAYLMRFNPDDPGPGNRSKANGWQFAPTGPPVYRTTFTKSMTGTGSMPYQFSSAVTLRTGWPRHWGRCYLPTPLSSTLDANGRLGATFRGTVTGAFKALGDTLADADFLPCVPVSDLNRQPYHALLGVTLYGMDDVPDVQRRRRPRQPALRMYL